MSCFTKNLTRTRKEAGLTQEQLAERVNVTRQAISCWERGRTEPDIETIIRLAQALNVETEELIFGRKAKPYNRFQRKYLTCSMLFLTLVLVILVLQVTLAPYLKEHVNTLYKGGSVYFLMFQLLLPTIEYVSLGIFAVSFIAMFYRICLCGKWKRITFWGGIITFFPSVMAFLDFLFTMLLPVYKSPFFYTLFIGTISFPPIQILLFVLFPVMSGVFWFLCVNKETKSKDISLDN